MQVYIEVKKSGVYMVIEGEEPQRIPEGVVDMLVAQMAVYVAKRDGKKALIINAEGVELE